MDDEVARRACRFLAIKMLHHQKQQQQPQSLSYDDCDCLHLRLRCDHSVQCLLCVVLPGIVSHNTYTTKCSSALTESMLCNHFTAYTQTFIHSPPSYYVFSPPFQCSTSTLGCSIETLLRRIPSTPSDTHRIHNSHTIDWVKY